MSLPSFSFFLFSSFCLPWLGAPLFVATTSIVWLFARSAHTLLTLHCISTRAPLVLTRCFSLRCDNVDRVALRQIHTPFVPRLALFDRSPSRETSVQSLTVVSNPSHFASRPPTQRFDAADPCAVTPSLPSPFRVATLSVRQRRHVW